MVLASWAQAQEQGVSIRAARRPTRNVEAIATDSPTPTDDEPVLTAPPESGPSASKASTPAAAATAAKSQAATSQAAAATKNPGVRVTQSTPSLAIEMVGPERVSVGKEAAYILKLENKGPASMRDVVISIAIGEGAEVTEARASSGSTSLASKAAGCLWRFEKLDPFAEHELALTVTPHKSVPAALEVTWTYAQPAFRATLAVDEPKLELELAGPTDVIYGQHQAYHLTIKNPGTGDAEHVVVRLPSAEDAVGSTFHVGTLKAGAHTTLELDVAANHTGRMAIQAEVSGDENLRVSANKEILVHRPGLEVVVSTPRAHYAGAPATCEVRVRNPGDSPAHNVHLSVKLPEGAELISTSDDGALSESKGEIAWKMAELAPGAEKLLSIKCKLSKPGEVSIDAIATAGNDLQSTNSAAVQVVPVAALTLDVVGAPGPIAVGTTTEYTITIRNCGTTSAEDLELLGIFSDGLAPIGSQDNSGEIAERTIKLTPASISVGGAAHYKVMASASASGNHQLRVELRSKSLGVRLAQELSTFFYVEQASAGSANR
jgi:hypothetical protein